MAFKMKGSPYPNKPTPIKQKEKGKDVEGSPPDLNYSMEKVQQGPISEAEKNAKMRQLSEDLRSGKKTVPLPSDLMPKGGKRWKI